MGRFTAFLFKKETVECHCKKCGKTVEAKKKPIIVILYVVWIVILMTVVFALFDVILPYGILFILFFALWGPIYYFVFPYFCTECDSSIIYTKRVR